MILFLDFDGVLHPEPVKPGYSELFCRRPLLWDILDACPHLGVMFSTSWRQEFTVDQLIEFVTENGGESFTDRFLGALPTLFSEPGAYIARPIYKRESEIKYWLFGNRLQTMPWMALDDFAGNFSPNCPNLLLVDPETGLTKANVISAIERTVTRLV